MHRIGRTGRAGKLGNAISLVSAHEVGYLVDIEKLIKRPIEQVAVAGFEPEPEYEYPPGNKKKRGAQRRSSPRSPSDPNVWNAPNEASDLAAPSAVSARNVARRAVTR